MNSVALSYRFDSVPAGPRDHIRQSFLPPSLPSHQKGIGAMDSNGKTTRNFSGEDANSLRRVSTADVIDFFQYEANKKTIKEVARLSGLSVRSVENIRSGKSALNGATLSTWLTNDPELRTRYFQFVGGYLETDPEFVPALYAAINAVIRQRGE